MPPPQILTFTQPRTTRIVNTILRSPTSRPNATMTAATPLSLPSSPPPTQISNGDLNNVLAMRPVTLPPVEAAYAYKSLAISPSEDDAEIRSIYRPFLLSPEVQQNDWISQLELSEVVRLAEAEYRNPTGLGRLRVLVMYGSLRQRSFSKLLAFEASRILHRLGCDVRVYDPSGLPMKDDVQHDHPKVQELRELSKWSDGQVWVSPEQHGNLTAVFKNQIDWLPLSLGSVRPTQGRTLALAQVSGGSQSFNAVNSLRILGRWMRMFVIPNQSSVPKAWTQFTDALASDVTPEEELEKEGGSRMKPSDNRMRIVDCMEEFVKFTILMRPSFGLFGDRASERVEKREKEEKLEKAKLAEAEKVRQELVDTIVPGQLVNGVDLGRI